VGTRIPCRCNRHNAISKVHNPCVVHRKRDSDKIFHSRHGENVASRQHPIRMRGQPKVRAQFQYAMPPVCTVCVRYGIPFVPFLFSAAFLCQSVFHRLLQPLNRTVGATCMNASEFCLSPRTGNPEIFDLISRLLSWRNLSTSLQKASMAAFFAVSARRTHAVARVIVADHRN